MKNLFKSKREIGIVSGGGGGGFIISGFFGSSFFSGAFLPFFFLVAFGLISSGFKEFNYPSITTSEAIKELNPV